MVDAYGCYNFQHNIKYQNSQVENDVGLLTLDIMIKNTEGKKSLSVLPHTVINWFFAHATRNKTLVVLIMYNSSYSNKVPKH